MKSSEFRKDIVSGEWLLVAGGLEKIGVRAFPPAEFPLRYGGKRGDRCG